MNRAQIERRLRDNVQRLRAARSDLEVTEQQVLSLAEDAEDLRVRALVADDLRVASEHREASRHLEAMTRHRDELADEIARLDAAQDELLDRLGSGD